MDRRRFLERLCTAIGTVGVGGMVYQGARPRTPPCVGPSVGRPGHGDAGRAGDCGTTASGSSGDDGAGTASVGPEARVTGRTYDRDAEKARLKIAESRGFVPRDAEFWEPVGSGAVRCTLCPIGCVLRPYERGQCRVRIGLENRLATLVFGRPCSVAVDPIEKKPVFHLWPGSGSFSIATAGCMLGCRYCQNWQISQEDPENLESYDLPPAAVVARAMEHGCRSIAYTYTEPTVFYEYMLETAKIAQTAGLGNVMVSSGYLNPEPLARLLPYLTVFKVDLKGFTERFYRSVSGGTLAPVLAALEQAGRAGTMVDIVTLVVPTLNDDETTMDRMFQWIAERLGPRVTLFLSRFHPTYRLRNLPPTPVTLLTRLRERAMAAGLPYVYLGNVPGHAGESTWCPKCGQRLVWRDGYTIVENRLRNGNCPDCGTDIPGRWE